MSTNFWKKKHVLITGASGFVGSHLCRYLEQKGAHVIALSRGGKRKGLIHIDVNNKKLLDTYFRKYPMYACFHLAGVSLVEQGQLYPYETFVTNITGTLNVLELSRKYRVKRIIIASTAHVYGSTNPPSNESDPPRPSRPYETSKTCTDLIAQSYADSYNLPVLIPRFVNIYGPGDTNYSRLIPKTIQTILQKRSPSMWGGKSVREYLYIDDVLAAYERLALMPSRTIEKDRIINFGTDKPISVSQLISLIIKLSRTRVTIRKLRRGRHHEVMHQYVDSGKAKRLLHWAANTSLESGLQKTIDWHKTIDSE